MNDVNVNNVEKSEKILLGSIQLAHKTLALKVLDNGHGGLLVGHKPLLQTLLIVIRPVNNDVIIIVNIIVIINNILTLTFHYQQLLDSNILLYKSLDCSGRRELFAG